MPRKKLSEKDFRRPRQVRMSDREYALARQDARREGFGFGEYVRRLLRSRRNRKAGRRVY